MNYWIHVMNISIYVYRVPFFVHTFRKKLRETGRGGGRGERGDKVRREVRQRAEQTEMQTEIVKGLLSSTGMQFVSSQWLTIIATYTQSHAHTHTVCHTTILTPHSQTDSSFCLSPLGSFLLLYQNLLPSNSRARLGENDLILNQSWVTTLNLLIGRHGWFCSMFPAKWGKAVVDEGVTCQCGTINLS